MNDWQEMMHPLISGTVLCHLNEIPDGGAKEVVFGAGPDCFRVLLLRLGKEAYAYHNCCPHYSLPLNYEPQEFYVYDREYLMCAHHTALFRIEDGECFDGPCAGAHLTRVAIVNDGNTVRVA